MLWCSRSCILSPHIGHSLTAIDFSPIGPYRNGRLMHGNTFRRPGGLAALMTRETLREAPNWFADEVCIDFPSPAPAIERVRQSFLADERPPTVRATVELTDREAAFGVTLPLDVPVHCTCAGCGGRGESWTETCAQCQGSGVELVRHPVQITVPAGVRDGARFCFTVTPRHHRSTRIELHVAVAAGR